MTNLESYVNRPLCPSNLSVSPTSAYRSESRLMVTDGAPSRKKPPLRLPHRARRSHSARTNVRGHSRTNAWCRKTRFVRLSVLKIYALLFLTAPLPLTDYPTISSEYSPRIRHKAGRDSRALLLEFTRSSKQARSISRTFQ